MKAVLFDFEGTLVDCQWKLRDAVNEVREKLLSIGLNIDEINYSLLYNKALKAAEKLGFNIRPVLDEIYDKYDMDALNRWNLRESSVIVLEKIKKSGIKTALVTNVGRKAIDIALKKFNLSFDVIVTRNEMKNLKPSPYGLIKAMAALKEKDAIFVGDSISDIIAAKQAGIPVVIIAGGESDIKEIRKMKPDFLLANLSEVLKVLEV